MGAIDQAPDKMEEGAATFRERNAVYGNNSEQVGKVMEVLFPNGLTLKTNADFERFHLFMLKIVKLTRYGNNFTIGGHEDSIRDDGVYSFMLEAVDEFFKGERDDK